MRLVLLLIAIGLVSGGCTAAQPGVPVQQDFRIIGYATEASIPEIIQYDKLTHINYSFLIPNSDGTFARLANGWKLKKIVELAHASDVKVLISVGGWGWDAQFETLAAAPETRSRFVQEVLAFMEAYQLDGIDLDWEYPDPGVSSQNFLELITELRQAMPAGKLLTAAVVAYNDEHGLGIPAEAFEIFDFINIMAYDGRDHGSMKQAEAAFDYWLGRGLPKEKAVLGVPFYGHPSFASYKKLVESDPAAAQVDQFLYLGALQTYNGIPTIQAKTRLALERGSGIMFWTLDYDTVDEYSLLTAIFTTVHGGQ